MPKKHRPNATTSRITPSHSVIVERWKLIVLALFFLGLGMMLGFFMNEYVRRGSMELPHTGLSHGALPVEQEIRALLAHISEAETQLFANPNNPQIRVHIGNLYYDLALAREQTADGVASQESWQRAIRHYEAAHELGLADADMLTDLGTAYFRTNEPERAIELYEAAIAVNPRNANTWMNIGVVKRQALDDIAGAQVAWQEYLRLDPVSANAGRVRMWLDEIGGAPAN